MDKILVKNQDINIEITALTNEGSGIGRYNGIAVFVPNTAVGDVIECHIIKVKKNYAIGKIKEIIIPSVDRITPDCAVYNRCGGCVYRHIDYNSELRVKKQNVVDVFERIAKLDVKINDCVGADSRSRYRNKAQYPVREENGEIKIGFYAPNSHRVIDCRDCLLQPEEFSEILNIFEKWIKKYGISAYNEETDRGLLRHIYLRKGFATGEIMVCPVINGNKLPFDDELCDMLINTVSSIKTIVVNINKQKTNVILSDKCVTLYGDGYIEDILCDVKVRLSPLSFYQVNREQAQRLYYKAGEYAGINENMTVLDLYCGTGTIGLALAENAKLLIGAEIIPEAIEDAKVNAQINCRNNTRFICGDAADTAKILKNENINADVVILAPPRKGCSEELLNTVCEINPDKIVYISCDPATLARDCAVLDKLGYMVEEVTPFDLFPATSHVETVVLLSRKMPDIHIDLEINLDELDATAAETKATYQEIKDYVFKEFGLKVSSLNISQVKTECGIIERENYNKGKPNRKQPNCTEEKRAAIKKALQYFQMI